MRRRDVGNERVFKEVLPEKEELPREVTVEGTFTAVSATHWKKAKFPILLTEVGNCINVTPDFEKT